jgi:hypothetical protein
MDGAVEIFSDLPLCAESTSDRLLPQVSHFHQSVLAPDNTEKSLKNVTAISADIMAYWIYPDLGH